MHFVVSQLLRLALVSGSSTPLGHREVLDYARTPVGPRAVPRAVLDYARTPLVPEPFPERSRGGGGGIHTSYLIIRTSFLSFVEVFLNYFRLKHYVIFPY